MPVSYDIFGLGCPPVREAYGQWQVYVPGPKQAAPWLDKSDVLAAGADAFPGDGV